MVDLTKINRELARLDGELRSGRLDVARFRAERRRILLDFDERTSTTLPGATAGAETTLVDPPFELPDSTSTQAPAAEQIPAKRGLPVGLLLTAVAGLIAAAVAAWWFFGQPSATKSAASTATPLATELPQDVAGALMQTNWSAADLDVFLQRWQRLPPAAIRAASDDPRIWLLRGETDRRLRDASDAESVDPSDESKARMQKLQDIQAVIRAP